MYHVAVLLREAIDGLAIRPDGIYVDCTFGGGGHARAILEQLSQNGKLFAFDQDADARQNLPDDPRVTFVPHNFRHLARFLRLHQVVKVDGILADLGVSTHQFDESTRGFSTRFDSDLDMRMDQRSELTAADVLNRYTEAQLHKIFEQYGEVTNAKTLARTIVEKRQAAPLKNSAALRSMLQPIVKGNPHKYFAQLYQALRIEVNDELGALKELLEQIPPLLEPGGRVAIITFHSLEDRMVKNFFKRGMFEEADDHPFESNRKPAELEPVTRKPIVPTDNEIKENSRSRSAKLRVAEKV
jgi:16S rRNA (cytosine1402-N4)-methyltransferase